MPEVTSSYSGGLSSCEEYRWRCILTFIRYSRSRGVHPRVWMNGFPENEGELRSAGHYGNWESAGIRPQPGGKEAGRKNGR